jgi:hypothetical protein
MFANAMMNGTLLVAVCLERGELEAVALPLP